MANNKILNVGIFCVVVIILLLVSSCSTKETLSTELPALTVSQADHGTGSSIQPMIPGINLAVTGEFSLRNGLGKLAAGTDAGIYYVLRGKLFFWEYAQKFSLEIADLNTRDGSYYYAGDHPSETIEPGKTVLKKFMIPRSYLVLYKDRLYYAQATQASSGESSYEIVSLNLQGQDATTEFKLPEEVASFFLLDNGNTLLYEVKVDQGSGDHPADVIRLYSLQKNMEKPILLSDPLFPDHFYCNETTCFFSALSKEEDLSTTQQTYSLYSWDVHSKEIKKESAKTGGGFYPQRDHLVSVDTKKYLNGYYQLDYIYGDLSRKTVYERGFEEGTVFYYGASDLFSFVAVTENVSQGKWNFSILDPSGNVLRRFPITLPDAGGVGEGIVGSFILFSRHAVEEFNYNYYLLDVNAEKVEMIPLLPDGYFEK